MEGSGEPHFHCFDIMNMLHADSVTQVAHCYTTHKDEKIDFTLEGITWGRVPRDQYLDAQPLEEVVAAQLSEKRDAERQWLCGLCSAWTVESKHATGAHVHSE